MPSEELSRKPLDWLPPDGRAARVQAAVSGFIAGAALGTGLLVIAASYDPWGVAMLASEPGQVAVGAMMSGGLGLLLGYLLKLDAQRREAAGLPGFGAALVLVSGVTGFVLGALAVVGVASEVCAMAEECGLEALGWTAFGALFAAVAGAAIAVAIVRRLLRPNR